MERKSTDDLQQELMSQNNIDTYLKENAALFSETDVAAHLSELYRKQSISKAALARKAGMSEVYLHQVFAGRRNPSRDRLLCLCAGLNAGLEDTQDLLKQSGYAQLHPKNRRDAIIIHGLIHGTDLEVINEKLFSENERSLF